MFATAGISAPPKTEADFIADAKKLTLTSGGKTYAVRAVAGGQPDHPDVADPAVDERRRHHRQERLRRDQRPGERGGAHRSGASSSCRTHISPVGPDRRRRRHAVLVARRPRWRSTGRGRRPATSQPASTSASRRSRSAPRGPVTLGVDGPADDREEHASTRRRRRSSSPGTRARPRRTKFSQVSGFPPARTDITSAVVGQPDRGGVRPGAARTRGCTWPGQPHATQIDTDVYVPLIQKITRGADVQTAADAAATADQPADRLQVQLTTPVTGPRHGPRRAVPRPGGRSTMTTTEAPVATGRAAAPPPPRGGRGSTARTCSSRRA